MTLDSASLTRMEERGIKDMEREPDVKEEQGGMDKEIGVKCQTINHKEHKQ